MKNPMMKRQVPVSDRVKKCYASELDLKKLFPYSDLAVKLVQDMGNNGEYPTAYAAIPLRELLFSVMNGANIELRPRTQFRQPSIGVAFVSGPSGGGKSTAQADFVKAIVYLQQVAKIKLMVQETTTPALLQIMHDNACRPKAGQAAVTKSARNPNATDSDTEVESSSSRTELAAGSQEHAGSVLMLLDEGAGFLSSLQDKNMEKERSMFLQLWGDGALVQDRVSKGRSRQINNPHFNLIAFTQADRLCAILDAESAKNVNDGFVARTTLCNPQPVYRSFFEFSEPRKDVPALGVVLVVAYLLHLHKPRAVYVPAPGVENMQDFAARYSLVKARQQRISVIDDWASANLSKSISQIARGAMYHKALHEVMLLVAKHNLLKQSFDAENKTMEDFEELLRVDLQVFKESEQEVSKQHWEAALYEVDYTMEHKNHLNLQVSLSADNVKGALLTYPGPRLDCSQFLLDRRTFKKADVTEAVEELVGLGIGSSLLKKAPRQKAGQPHLYFTKKDPNEFTAQSQEKIDFMNLIAGLGVPWTGYCTAHELPEKTWVLKSVQTLAKNKRSVPADSDVEEPSKKKNKPDDSPQHEEHSEMNEEDAREKLLKKANRAAKKQAKKQVKKQAKEQAKDAVKEKAKADKNALKRDKTATND